MADEPNPDGLIASRLEHLFRTVDPADRGPYTPGDVAAAINAEAGEDVISGHLDRAHPLLAWMERSRLFHPERSRRQQPWP